MKLTIGYFRFFRKWKFGCVNPHKTFFRFCIMWIFHTFTYMRPRFFETNYYLAPFFHPVTFSTHAKPPSCSFSSFSLKNGVSGSPTLITTRTHYLNEKWMFQNVHLSHPHAEVENSKGNLKIARIRRKVSWKRASLAGKSTQSILTGEKNGESRERISAESR